MIREEIEHCIRTNPLNGFDTVSQWGIDVLEELFKKLAKQLCDKQKQICYENAKVVKEYDNLQQDFISKSVGTEDASISVYKNSIVNTPYPEELL